MSVVMKRKAETRLHLTACPITGLPIKMLTPKKLNASQGVTAKTLANTLKNQLGYDDALECLSKDQLIAQYCAALQKQLEAPAASLQCDRTACSPAPAVSSRSPRDSQRQSRSASSSRAGAPARKPAPARLSSTLTLVVAGFMLVICMWATYDDGPAKAAAEAKRTGEQLLEEARHKLARQVCVCVCVWVCIWYISKARQACVCARACVLSVCVCV